MSRELELASLARWKANLDTVWDQHTGDKDTWMASLKTGDQITVYGHRIGEPEPFKQMGYVSAVMPSFDFLFVRMFDVYSPNMVSLELCFLLNGNPARNTAAKFHTLSIGPDERLGRTMDGNRER